MPGAVSNGGLRRAEEPMDRKRLESLLAESLIILVMTISSRIMARSPWRETAEACPTQIILQPHPDWPLIHSLNKQFFN